MKTNLFKAVLLMAVLVAAGCADDDNQGLPVKSSIVTGEYQSLRLKGHMTLHIDQLGDGALDVVQLESDFAQTNEVRVGLGRSGELVIETTNHGIDKEHVRVYLNVADLDSIILEGDSKVDAFTNVDTDYLSIVTQGATSLMLEGITATEIHSKIEGDSELTLSSKTAIDDATLSYNSEFTDILSDNVINVNDSILVEGDSIYTSGNQVVVVGNPANVYRTSGSHTIRREGGSRLYAHGFPTFNTDIKNEGAGVAYVTALESLQVVGEGASKLYYKGAPLITQNLSGTAAIINNN